MGQPYETDFWIDAANRKIWDDIVPSEPRPTIPYLLTLAAIDTAEPLAISIPFISTRITPAKAHMEELIAPPAIHILLMLPACRLTIGCAAPAP